jgi:hypothetical protein
MPERRGSRFAAEALFLVALAVCLSLARLDSLEIAGAMLLGWLVVAAIEWAAWRSEPHYGSGLPPRYHVPPLSLPPPQPLEQVDQGYPEAAVDDAPTWIASAALRAEVLGTWPVAARPLPDEGDDEEPEPVFATPAERDADPWTVAALPAAPVGETEPERHAVAPVRRVSAGPVPTARYTLDPLSEPAPRGRFGRRGSDDGAWVTVPARPQARLLPGAARAG